MKTFIIMICFGVAAVGYFAYQIGYLDGHRDALVWARQVIN